MSLAVKYATFIVHTFEKECVCPCNRSEGIFIFYKLLLKFIYTLKPFILLAF